MCRSDLCTSDYVGRAQKETIEHFIFILSFVSSEMPAVYLDTCLPWTAALQGGRLTAKMTRVIAVVGPCGFGEHHQKKMIDLLL